MKRAVPLCAEYKEQCVSLKTQLMLHKFTADENVDRRVTRLVSYELRLEAWMYGRMTSDIAAGAVLMSYIAELRESRAK